MEDDKIEKFKQSVIIHRNKVIEVLRFFRNQLKFRGEHLDESKFFEPELEIFAEYEPKLKEVPLGSKEYNYYLSKINDAYKDHYLKTRHHPEHYPNGIKGMNLIDIVELFSDWKINSIEDKKNLIKEIYKYQDKYHFSDELLQIFINTGKLLFTYRIIYTDSSTGKLGEFLADSIDEIHNSIDYDKYLSDEEKDILKYGYSNEFKNEDYHNLHVETKRLDCYWYKQEYMIK